MADTTGPISSLPGSSHDPPEGTMCDEHPDRKATVRLQGETDSFGCEMHDLCDECARAERASTCKDIGECEWCHATANRKPYRDYEEGLAGRVYYVCVECIRKDNARWAREDEYYDD